MRRAPPCLLKVEVAELVRAGYNGSAHGPILVRALSPGQAGGSIDPQGEPHCHNGLMPTEKDLLDRIRQLEEQNSVLQDKLDMIYAILAPDFEEVDPDAEDGDDGLVQIGKGDLDGRVPAAQEPSAEGQSLRLRRRR